MKANSSQLNLSDDRQKEYQRQQERLKAMTATTDKVKSVSADLMIENLLKDSFKKVSQTSPLSERPDAFDVELPPWLKCKSSMVPPQFKYLWSLVQSESDLADTQKVSQLLLTSGLHVDVLGYIWNLANRALPGQLTKQEFYIVLALVGLAQTGYTFNSLGVLKLIPTPSIPVLHANVLKNQVSQSCKPYNVQFGCFQQFQNSPIQGASPLTNSKENDNQSDQFLTNSCVSEKNLFFDNTCDTFQDLIDNKREKFEPNLEYNDTKSLKITKPHVIEMNKGPYKSSNFPYIGSSPTAEIEDDFTEFQSVPVKKVEEFEKVNYASCESADDFTEFQSANVEHLDSYETVVITQKREIPKIPLPQSLSGKLNALKSNILKISPESERKLKVLTQPESLSSLPESKISSNNKVSTSLSVLGSNHGVGSRLANHSLSAKLDRPRHHKHHKVKSNLSTPIQSNTEEEIILGVKTTNIENLIPKCFSKKSNNCQTFILKETKIRNDEIPEFPGPEQLGNEPDSHVLHSGENTRQIEIPMLGTFNETVLPTLTKSQTSSIDLISVQEDKYSALREIEIKMNQDKTEEKSGLEEINDEFGDFLSADIPPPPLPSSASQVTNSSSVSFFEENEEKESWGEWNFRAEASLKSTDISVPVVNNSELMNYKESSATLPSKSEEDVINCFNLLAINDNENEGKKNQLPSSRPFTAAQDDIFCEILFDCESNTILNASVLSHNSDSLSSVAFEDEQNEKTNYFSSQTKSPMLINNHGDNEFLDFLISDIKPSTEGDFNRHGSLPSLNLKMSMTEESEQEVVWRKCLESCHNLINEGFEIFNNISVKPVLDEVCAAPKTNDYLNHLSVAYQISKRISRNWNELPSTQEYVERMWRRLEELCSEYKIQLKQIEGKTSEGKYQCNICLGYIDQDFINQGTSTYHPSCANLWINFVDEILPCST